MQGADKQKIIANMVRVIANICKMSITQSRVDFTQNLNDEKCRAGEGGHSIVSAVPFSLSLQIKCIPYRGVKKIKLSTKVRAEYEYVKVAHKGRKKNGWVQILKYQISLAEGFGCLPLSHRWQTQGPRAESSPPPCFFWPSTLFLPNSSAQLSLACEGVVTFTQS